MRGAHLAALHLLMSVGLLPELENIPMISELLILIALLVAILVLANFADRRPALGIPLRWLLFVINMLIVLYGLSVRNLELENIQIAPEAAQNAAIIGVVLGGLCTLLLFSGIRQQLVPLFPPRRVDTATAESQGFDPNSNVHMTALIFCLYLFANTLFQFVLSGGLSGLAANFEAPTTTSLLLQMALFLLFAVLGVGFKMRRSFGGTLNRLGLRLPTVWELFNAAGATFMVFAFAFFIGIVWQTTTPSDVIDEQQQLSGAIAMSIDTMFLGFMLAWTAAIGEEIAFRGALQPIFGLVPTSLIFVLIHIQYTLTPATLIIFVVALTFGWLRKRFNTTTAITAHFLYNFIQVALLLYSRYYFDVIEPNLRR